MNHHLISEQSRSLLVSKRRKVIHSWSAEIPLQLPPTIQCECIPPAAYPEESLAAHDSILHATFTPKTPIQGSAHVKGTRGALPPFSFWQVARCQPPATLKALPTAGSLSLS
ncbi:hypothetical protein CC2G_004501 [Coprinopsis cinerea AmutBmut pab1-1]|nr:hypothetical protein CC2G_004501 [Coprinopsis cinerea AmutBmut pab1-1]